MLQVQEPVRVYCDYCGVLWVEVATSAVALGVAAEKTRHVPTSKTVCPTSCLK